VLAVGAIAVSAQYQWLAVARRRSQRLAWSNAFHRLRAATGLVSASVLTPTWPAWPLPLPQVALDHILVSPDLTIAAEGTGPAVG